MDNFTIYTDGACRGNQNQNAPGGYGAIVVNGHAGHPENERADELACLAADSGELLSEDKGTW